MWVRVKRSSRTKREINAATVKAPAKYVPVAATTSRTCVQTVNDGGEAILERTHATDVRLQGIAPGLSAG